MLADGLGVSRAPLNGLGCKGRGAGTTPHFGEKYGLAVRVAGRGRLVGDLDGDDADVVPYRLVAHEVLHGIDEISYFSPGLDRADIGDQSRDST